MSTPVHILSAISLNFDAATVRSLPSWVRWEWRMMLHATADASEVMISWLILLIM